MAPTAGAPRPRLASIVRHGVRRPGPLTMLEGPTTLVGRAELGPVLLVFADADAIRTDHIMAFYVAARGPAGAWSGRRRRDRTAQLAILPGCTHYEPHREPAACARPSRHFWRYRAARPRLSVLVAA